MATVRLYTQALTQLTLDGRTKVSVPFRFLLSTFSMHSELREASQNRRTKRTKTEPNKFYLWEIGP